MMPLQCDTDDDLLRRMRAGDEAAFTVLYRRRQGAVYRFALHMSGSPSIAEEVTQEVFMKLIRDPESFDPARGALASFLYGIARNIVLRHFERDPIGESVSDAHEGLTSRHDVLGDLTRRETIESVRRAILSLPANYREAVVLCDLQELSYEDAAGVLGCAVGTVRSRLHRARAMLTGKLQARCFA
jgi:RNA polymerase sigma-70 factor (ECF subfamily)